MKNGILLALAFSSLTLAGSFSFAADDCSAQAIIQATNRAYKEQPDTQGKLWGTQLCTKDTKGSAKVAGKLVTFNCFNSCALVVSAILKEAGCQVNVTSSASSIWNALRRLKLEKTGQNAFMPSERQRAGCVIGMNSNQTGGKDRLVLPGKSGPKVAFRHVAIATSGSGYIDNYSLTNTPKIDYNGFFDWTKYADSYQYDKFIYLCPTN